VKINLIVSSTSHGNLNDIWSFNLKSQEWCWLSGDYSNTTAAVSFFDRASKEMFLFSGFNTVGAFK
jgi:hypothetical protein